MFGSEDMPPRWGRPTLSNSPAGRKTAVRLALRAANDAFPGGRTSDLGWCSQQKGCHMLRLAVVLAVAGAFVLALEEAPAARQQRNSGVSNTCGEFEVLVINGGIFGSLAITAPDEGW